MKELKFSTPISASAVSPDFMNLMLTLNLNFAAALLEITAVTIWLTLVSLFQMPHAAILIKKKFAMEVASQILGNAVPNQMKTVLLLTTSAYLLNNVALIHHISTVNGLINVSLKLTSVAWI